MLQSQTQQEIKYEYQPDINDSTSNSDGIGSSLASSPAPSLTDSTSSTSNHCSPNKFAYSTPYLQANTRPDYFKQQPPAYYNHMMQQSKYIPNNFQQQMYQYQQYNNRMYSDYQNNSFNDSSYQSRNNSFNFSNESIESYKVPKQIKPVINSLSKFSIEAILAKPSNIKNQQTTNKQVFKRESQFEMPVKEKGKRKKRTATAELETSISNNKRIRTIFTQDQLDKLEIEFLKQQYMVGSERTYLASSLGLSESQVKIWFQNRRIKWRKTTAEEQSTHNHNEDDEEIVNETRNSNSNDSIDSYDDE